MFLSASATYPAGSVERNRIIRERINYYQSPGLNPLVSPLFSCKFNPHYNLSYILGGCDEKGSMIVYNTIDARRGMVRPVSAMQWHYNAAMDFDWSPAAEQKVVIGSADNSISYADLLAKRRISVYSKHLSSIRSVNFCAENENLFVSGGRDGCIIMWDVRQAVQPVQMLPDAHQWNVAKKSPVKQPICALLYNCQRYVLSAGYADKGIHVWDIRKTRSIARNACSPRYIWPYEPANLNRTSRIHCYTSFTVDTARNGLFVPCTDGTLYMYTLSNMNPKPVRRLRAGSFRNMYARCAVCPYAPYVVCDVSKSDAGIWCYTESEYPKYMLKGHRAELTCSTWNVGSQLVTACDDPGFRVWLPNWDKGKISPESAGYESIKQLSEQEITELFRSRQRYSLFSDDDDDATYDDNYVGGAFSLRGMQQLFRPRPAGRDGPSQDEGTASPGSSNPTLLNYFRRV